MQRVVVITVLAGAVGVGVWLMVGADPSNPVLPLREPRTWAQSRGEIAASVMPKTWVELDRKKNPLAPPVLTRPFDAQLVEVTSDAEGMVDVETVRGWGLDAGEVFEVARMNARLLGPWKVESLDGGLFVVTVGHEVSSTAVLTWPEKVAALPLAGPAVVGFGRIDVVVADGARPEALDGLLSALSFESAYVTGDGDADLVALGGRIYVLADAGWAEWQPPAELAGRYKAQRERADANERAAGR